MLPNILSSLNLSSPSSESTMSPVQNRIRQNFHYECEQALNKQVNMELYASYAYLTMYSYFIKHDKALHGFAKMFLKSSQEEKEHALLLIDYLAKRGGTALMEDVKKPEIEFVTAMDAVEVALKLEKDVNESLLGILALSAEKADGHLSDFLEENFLGEQVDSIKAFGDLLTRMDIAGDGLGLLYIDKELQKKYA